MSVKLTDAQLVMMSAATQREDRCLAAPETMKSAVVTKTVAKLVKLGFAPMALAGRMPRRRRLRFVTSPSRRPTGSQTRGAPGPIWWRFASL